MLFLLYMQTKKGLSFQSKQNKPEDQGMEYFYYYSIIEHTSTLYNVMHGHKKWPNN